MRQARKVCFAVLATFVAMATTDSKAEDLWVVYDGFDGPGKGKHVVLIAGDEEYRSEEALPQLGKILAKHHGFKCTVVFSVDEKTGLINPDNRKNIPGLGALKTADLMISATRFRELPDEQMKHIDDYVQAGKPIIGVRTATHAFNKNSGKYKNYHWRSNGEWKGGFGEYVLGETWISHHGGHGSEATRGIIAKEAKDHPILRGIKDGDIFGPTDVYGVKLKQLLAKSKPLVLGQVVKGMKFGDPPREGKKNDPMMPVAWTKTYKAQSGKSGRVFTTTMGSSTDLLYEGTRRLLVNASYWAVGLEGKIPEKSKVDVVGKFETLPFKFGGYKRGVKPSDHAMKK